MRSMLEISLACLINQLSPSKPLEVNLSNGFFLPKIWQSENRNCATYCQHCQMPMMGKNIIGES